MCCYLTRTTKKTHQLIKDNLHETPTYGGWVEAKGPRYCPSIEDKVNSIVCVLFSSAHAWSPYLMSLRTILFLIGNKKQLYL